MENNSLVSVNILTYNRRNELRNTLSKVYMQNYKMIEIIVVDNASTDDTIGCVRNEFPEVNIIRLKSNIGISGWNEGFKIAKGEFVLVLDDDSYPDKDTIEKGIEVFTKEDNIGILAYNIFNNRKGESETKYFSARPYFFVGCGALIRKKVLDNIGYFNKDYFIYLHELDFSARCYDNGYDIKYLPSVFVYHNQSLQSRGKSEADPFRSRYRYKNYFISYSIFLIQKFPLSLCLPYMLKWIINRFIVSLRYLYFHEFIASLFHIIYNFGSYFQNRDILKDSTQKFYNYGNIPLIDPEFFQSNVKS